MTLEEERDLLRKEVRAVQEMLAQVLFAVGEEVRVDKSKMGTLPDGSQINIDDDAPNNQFVFSLAVPQ